MALLDITNRTVLLEKIRPHKKNYRMHPEEQRQDIDASLSRFGQYRSVVLWEQLNGTYIQVAGHGVVEQMKEKHLQEVRADILPINTPQATIDGILVADNNIALKSSDDPDLLRKLLQEQKNGGFDLASLGSDAEVLRQMSDALRPEHATDFLQSLLAPAHSTSEEMYDDDGQETPNFSSPTNHNTLFQVAYTVNSEQRGIILQALTKARLSWNIITAQDALVAMCSHFLKQELK